MTCRTPDCKNEKFENFNKCTLHCSNNDINDINRGSHKSKFREDFHQYIFERVKKFNNHKEGTSEEDIKKRHKVLSGIRDISKIEFYENEELNNIVEDNTINIVNIEFPEYIESYLCGYDYLLEKIGKVVFDNCIFYGSCCSESKNIFYKNCSFKKKFYIYANLESNNDDEHASDERGKKCRYEKCSFEDNVYISDKGNADCIDYNIFYECVFRKNISIRNVKIYEDFLILPNYEKEKGGIINLYNISDKSNKLKIDRMFTFMEVLIDNSSFFKTVKINGIGSNDIRKYKQYKGNDYKDFIAPHLKIKFLKIENTDFKGKLELKNAKVEVLDFYDSNVQGIFDVNESNIKKASFYKSIFEEFVAFEGVRFGDGKEENITDFKHTTFKEFSSFREADFTSGLKFSQANTKQEPNFLNAKLNTNFTDRETLRIIKNSFESVGNNLEANKFFILEMEAYSKELFKDFDKDGKESDVLDKRYAEKFIFVSNWLISGFGRSYIRPLLLLISSIFAYNIFYSFYEIFYKTDIYSLPRDISMISDSLNNSARSFFPFSRFVEKRKGFEFISLLFVIWFAILTWQIIVAVKRNTQH